MGWNIKKALEMNGIDFVVDTNILIYLHEANPIVSPYINYSWSCSVITEIELLGAQNLSSLEKEKLRELISDCIIFPFSDNIKNICIDIRQKKRIKIPDAIIAATAIYFDSPLLSADKDFNDIPDLKFILI